VQKKKKNISYGKIEQLVPERNREEEEKVVTRPRGGKEGVCRKAPYDEKKGLDSRGVYRLRSRGGEEKG